MTSSSQRFLWSTAAVPALMVATSALAEPQPVEYVRVCDAYGVGFYYIPGTETCLRVGGYAAYDTYLPGTNFTLHGLAYEPMPDVLQNPADSVTTEVEGRTVSFGFRTSVDGSVPFLDSLGFEADITDLEGRGVSWGSLPNLGIPGVGEDFGVFFNSPTDYNSDAWFTMHQWSFKLEGTRALNPRGPVGGTSGVPTTNVNVLYGIRYSNTDTGIGYSALLDNVYGLTDVEYSTSFTENSVTPFIGLEWNAFRVTSSNCAINFGVSGRIGPSLTHYSGTDSLWTTGAVNLMQSTDINRSVANLFASVDGHVGVTHGPVTVDLHAGLQYGNIRNPNIYRPDSVEVSPGNYETAPTELNPKPLLTATAGVRLTFAFGFRTQRGF